MSAPKPREHYIVPCPVCGEEKWRYLGGDLDHEPPCAKCCAAAGRPNP